MLTIKKAPTLICIFGCLVIYGYSAIDIGSGQLFSVSIDLNKPLAIFWPFEVSIVGDNGEKGLHIGPNIGRGWRGEVGGKASYKFYIPKDGRYHLWAYCFWFDECSNAIFTQIDDMEKAIVGNDPIYKQWHWIRGFDVILEKGTHMLVLSNHSDHVSLQNVFLTNSAFTKPEECSVVFSDIFYDGFDGCDQGNFTAWEVVSGDWKIQNPTQSICLDENVLIGESKDIAFIVYRNDDWSSYSLNLIVKCVNSESVDGTVGVCFGVKDTNHYHQLRWRRIKETDSVKMEVCKITAEETEVITDFEVSWQVDNWHQVEIAVSANAVMVTVDDIELVEVPISYKITGGIGLHLEGKITSYFDDIHVRKVNESVM